MQRAIRMVVFLLQVSLPAYAQSVPGTRIAVEVRTVSIAKKGDTSQVDYIVQNLPVSQERVLALTVEAPSAPLGASSPTPKESWDNTLRYGGRAVVRWAALNDSILQPGRSSQLLWFRALGLPGIVDAHVEGHYELPETSEDDPAIEKVEDPLEVNSIRIRVVGIEPVPPGSTTLSLTSRLDSLLGKSCTLLWIASSSVCTRLREKLLQARQALTQGDNYTARTRLRSLLSELSAQHDAQGTLPVKDNAYWLLKVNAEHVLSRIPAR